MQEVILVDEQDRELGREEKMKAHEQGILHRAFSVFIFNQSGDMLLQQRALEKYHSGGLWSNACCSHPAPGEETATAAARRLQEELGFTTPLQKQFDFIYRAEFGNGLVEHEFDHVFTGRYEGAIPFNPEEVMEVVYLPMNRIYDMLQSTPEKFTAWFRIAFPGIRDWWQQQQTVTV